ncbi:MAG TPA: hypothetical protein VIF84_01845 [Candidatus Limnocylindrales bacterium]
MTEPHPTADEPGSETTSAPPSHAWGTAPAPPPSPTVPSPLLPIEATLRDAMGDVGAGFWRMLIVVALAFVPLWALIIWLGDHPAATIVQLLMILPSAAAIVAAGAVRDGRTVAISGSYRQALGRLLHYFLANLAVGVIILLIVLLPIIVLAIIAVAMAVQGAGADEPGPLGAVLVTGGILIALPVIGVGSRLGLIGPMIVLEQIGAGEALTGSWRRTHRQVVRLVVVFVVGTIPGWLVAAGAGLLAISLLAQPLVAGAVFGLGYSVAIVVVSCLNVVAWQRLGGELPMPDQPPSMGPESAEPAARRTDRGPLTAVLLLAGGLALVLAGSVTAAGKVEGWIADLAAGQQAGTVSFGTNGVECFQTSPRDVFEVGETIHAVAQLRDTLPAGERLEYEVFADDQLVDRGFEDPFSMPTGCLYFDLETTDIEPARYRFRYLWGADVVAEGSFSIGP